MKEKGFKFMKKRVTLCISILVLSMMFSNVYAASASTTPKTKTTQTVSTITPAQLYSMNVNNPTTSQGNTDSIQATSQSSNAVKPATSQAIDVASPAFDYKVKKLKYGKVIGKYIQISNLSDSSKQKKINALLKSDAKSILIPMNIDDTQITLDMDISAKYIKSTNLFVVIYSGYFNTRHSAHPSNFYNVSVIDMNKASRVNYTNKSEIAKIIKAVKKGKFTIKNVNKDIAKELKKYVSEVSDDELIDTLQHNNFYMKKNQIVNPYTFMYKTKNTLEVCIPTIHVLGDFMNISIKLKDIK